MHNPETQSAATGTAVTNSAATENIDVQESKPPESEPRANKPQKIRPASGISTPTTHPYSFAPQSVAGFRLAARNSLLPAGLRNPNDAAADFDRINPKRKFCNTT